jgi:hypothetical protein
MPDTLAITIIFIIVSTFIAAFIRGRCRDKCLKDFSGDTMTLQQTTGRTIEGELRVENTGMELFYQQKQKNAHGHDQASFILYKYEYPTILALLRFHDHLSPESKLQRQRQLEITYHPSSLRKLRRKIMNVFRTVRDSIAEVLNLLITHAKKTAALPTDDRYVTQVKGELLNTISTSYEPLLEKYIGYRVVLELISDGKVLEYSGVLKDYTADFIELMDVNYTGAENQPLQKADLIVPRKYGQVRHLGE